jgi:hypothetical protein
VRAVRNGVIASAVRKTPYTTQGWRPTSAVTQPLNVAMNGSGKVRNVAQSSSRFCSMRPLWIRYEPIQAISSMTAQQPTMMRKLKNGIATGGQFSGGMLSSPTSPAERSSESIKLPKGGGSVIANRFRWFSTSGQASSTSEAGFSSCHRASIAAIFAGWW